MLAKLPFRSVFSRFSGWLTAGAVALVVGLTEPSWAQPGGNALLYRVDAASQKLEMTVNTSRILTLEKKVPRIQVNNPELLEVTPLSATQIQLHAKKAGVTQINVWDEDDRIRTIDVVVYGDAQELTMILQSQFPRSTLRVTPLANSAILSGFVDRPSDVDSIMRIAEDYYPKIINNITVGGVQQVLLEVKVMEISRTKLRNLGFDWANISANGSYVVQSVSGLITGTNLLNAGVTASGGESLAFGIAGPGNSFFGVVEALVQNDVAKVLAEPKLVTISGRPAFFNAGGEFPILVPQALGTTSIQYRRFGTQVDFVPIVLGNGAIRLEVRPRVSEIDPSRSVTINEITVPGLRVREIDTGAELRAGQTLALAGLVQSRSESQVKGLPWLMDIPYAGTLFRRTHNTVNEIELLILVTPQLQQAMDPEQVPACGPGTGTTEPCDWEMYARGYIETPRCCPPVPGDPASPQSATSFGNAPGAGPAGEMGPSIEQIPAPAAGHRGYAPPTGMPTDSVQILHGPQGRPAPGLAAPTLRAPGAQVPPSRHPAGQAQLRPAATQPRVSNQAVPRNAPAASPARPALPSASNTPRNVPVQPAARSQANRATALPARSAPPAANGKSATTRTTGKPGFLGPTGYDTGR